MPGKLRDSSSFTSQNTPGVPGRFSRLVFCLAEVSGDFSVTGARMGESGIFEVMGSLAFSFRQSRRALVVADRLRFRACSGRFTLARRIGLPSQVGGLLTLTSQDFVDRPPLVSKSRFLSGGENRRFPADRAHYRRVLPCEGERFSAKPSVQLWRSGISLTNRDSGRILGDSFGRGFWRLQGHCQTIQSSLTTGRGCLLHH